MLELTLHYRDPMVASLALVAPIHPPTLSVAFCVMLGPGHLLPKLPRASYAMLVRIPMLAKAVVFLAFPALTRPQVQEVVPYVLREAGLR